MVSDSRKMIFLRVVITPWSIYMCLRPLKGSKVAFGAFWESDEGGGRVCGVY